MINVFASLGKKYCARCLTKFYHEQIPPKTNPDGTPYLWTCPGCRDQCSCAACKRHKARRELKEKRNKTVGKRGRKKSEKPATAKVVSSAPISNDTRAAVIGSSDKSNNQPKVATRKSPRLANRQMLAGDSTVKAEFDQQPMQQMQSPFNMHAFLGQEPYQQSPNQPFNQSISQSNATNQQMGLMNDQLPHFPNSSPPTMYQNHLNLMSDMSNPFSSSPLMGPQHGFASSPNNRPVNQLTNQMSNMSNQSMSVMPSPFTFSDFMSSPPSGPFMSSVRGSPLNLAQPAPPSLSMNQQMMNDQFDQPLPSPMMGGYPMFSPNATNNTNRSMNQSMHQPTNQSMNHSINQSMNQPMHQSMNQPMHHTMHQTTATRRSPRFIARKLPDQPQRYEHEQWMNYQQ